MTGALVNSLNVECALRLFIACICGGIIGIERTRRNKGAGIRTHIMVALGAALFVIASKYGFLDIVYIDGAQVDVSRIASNIVTGVSFLGAGVIFTRGDGVQGLTTAAGVWVTAAIGLAIGSGMYILGISCAILVLVIQVVLHRDYITGIENMVHSRIVICMQDDPEAYKKFQNQLKDKNITIRGSHIKRHKDLTLTYTLDVQMPKNLGPKDILSLVRECDNVKSIGM